MRFTALSDAGSSRADITAVANWAPDDPTGLSAPAALRSGLYLLSVAELQESAWVLVAPRSDLQQLETALAELESVSARWPLPAADSKGLRRALLEQLSREVVRKLRP